MGLFDKLKEKSRGIVTSAKPEDGVPQLSADEVRARLPAISGKGIETGIDGDEVVVSWSAKVVSAGPGGGDYEYRYRAVRLKLDEGDHEAEAICFKADTDAELGAGGLSATKGWERGQHVGSETVHDPAIDAVTGAGWTYKPRKA